MKPWERTARLYGSVLLAYTLLTLAMTWPVAARLHTHLVGDGDDMWVHYWNNWWVKRVLTEGGNVYATDLLFHPQTVSLVYHNFGWVNIAGWLLIEPVVGGIAASNLVYLANVTLCAFTMFVLARYLLKSEGPAFIAGLVYGYWPYRLSDWNHPNMISTEWLPLALLCVILLVRKRGQARYALLTGLFLALVALSRWQMALPAAVAIGVYLLFSILFERECWSWRVAGMLTMALLVTTLLVVVPFYPLARDLITGVASERLYLGEEAKKQTDLLAYFVPPVHHPLAPLFDSLSYVHSPMRFRFSAFLGYTVLALLVIGAAWRWRASRLWVVLASVAFLLALGPVLRLNYRVYPAVPMPHRLVDWLAPVRWLRYPHRFNTLLALPVAMLVGYGAVVARARLTRRRPVLLVGVLSALVLFDYYNLPLAMVQATTPAFYEGLSQDTHDFAVLDLPLGRDKGDYYMFYQTVHGHPIVEGNTARPQPSMFAFIDGSPLLHALRENEPLENHPPDISRQLTILADTGIRYVVVHKPFAKSDQLEMWSGVFVPAHEDDEVVAYRTALEYGRDFELVADLGDGIGLINRELSTMALPQDGLLEIDVIWGTHDPPTRDWAARIALVSPMGQVVQAIDTPPCVRWPTAEWGGNAAARGQMALRIDPYIAEGGIYSVTLTLVDPVTGDTAGEAAALGQVEVQAVERIFEVPELFAPVNATFGDQLRLLGYDLRHGQDLTLTLHWQALQRMDVAYKIFVHLFDPATQAIVSQADVMPYGWTYPTNWWEAGEVVSDEIALSLEDVPPGTYRLAVGVYHQESGERLPVTDAAGEWQPDGRLVLPEEVTK